MRFGILHRSVLSLFCLLLPVSNSSPILLWAKEAGEVQMTTGDETDEYCSEETIDSIESFIDESDPDGEYIRETLPSETSPASNFELSDQENNTAVLSGSNEEKLDVLRSLFPAGTYWNHLSPTTSYPMENISNAPCDSHETFSGTHRCNVFDSGAQCAGFAYLCYYKYHGYRRSNPDFSKRVSGNAGIRAGDVVHLQGHYGFVWKVEGDSLYVFEANYRGRCRISLTRAIPRSTVLDYWTPIVCRISHSANGGKGIAESQYIRADQDRLTGSCPFQKDNAAFTGWKILKTSTNQTLYTDGRAYRFFDSDTSAAKAGYSKPAIVGSGFNLKGIVESGDEIELQAQWQDDGYRVAFDAQGAAGAMAPLKVAFDEVRTLPACSFTKSGMRFAGWKVQNAKGEPLCSPTGLADAKRRWMKSEAEGRAAGLKPVVLSNQAPIRDLGSVKDETIVLLAQWEEIPVVETSMYRLYNPNSGEHFYTANASEKKMLVSVGWKDEGIGWKAPSRSSIPVYRLYNPNAGDHHYTTDAKERDALKKAGWKDEGIGWYSDEKKRTPLYRQYNPNAKAGAHNFTTSREENDGLVRLGWKAEGIAWYGQ